MKIKKMMTGAIALATVCTVNAAPILWDITGGTGAIDANASDFTDAGVTEDLTSASVSIVTGSASMSYGDITCGISSGTRGPYVNGTSLANVDGGAITQEYIAFKNVFEASPVTVTIGGLTNELEANQDYALYIWGVGDAVGQGSTFGFDGSTITVSETADPASASADNFVAKFSFNFGTTVSDTLDFTLYSAIDEGGHDYSALNGFAIVAIPEPATLGLVTAFGVGILFVRRFMR